MATREELEKLSSEELHHRALKRAVRHLDFKFVWSLFDAVPAAEAATGDLGTAEADIMTLTGRFNDLSEAGKGEVAEALRPLYLDYLEKHDG
jgi:hypothetical protein